MTGLTVLQDASDSSPRTHSVALIGSPDSVDEAITMLPRSRYDHLLDARGHPVDDIFDPELWRKNGWGLADPRQDKVLQMLLPEAESPEKRTRTAIEYLTEVFLFCNS